ncbi:MAG: MarR family transcriptional regulator [Peptococcaceae bacterium]|nr:MarR family transcriptional regulator [Peptococcaceae bacterium]
MERTIGHLIHFIHVKLKQDLNMRVHCFDVTSEQWDLLNSIYLEEGLSQKTLAQKTAKDEASVTRILDKLVAKGFVSKKYHCEDKRSYSLYLTEEGKELRNKIYPYALGTLDKAMFGLSPEEIRLFKQLLLRISHNLEQK